MTQGWRGRMDTSSLTVRALACTLLLLVLGALGPKRKAALHGSVPGAPPERITAKDAGEPLRACSLVGGVGNALATHN
jgi:hypothetical protein